jgi:hypothetical protein
MFRIIEITWRRRYTASLNYRVATRALIAPRLRLSPRSEKSGEPLLLFKRFGRRKAREVY